MTETITITNFMKSRRFGWGYSTTPTGEGPYSIEVPTKPMHTGTVGGVCDAIQNDRTFNSLGGTFRNTAWFWNGQRITHTLVYGIVEVVADLPRDYDQDGSPGHMRWISDNFAHHAANDIYGPVLKEGFDWRLRVCGSEVTIQVEGEGDE